MFSGKGKHERRSSRLPLAAMALGLLLLATPVLVMATMVPARAANVFNVTINIPADVRPHPCTGDLVNLSGELHMTKTVTEDTQGGFHMTLHSNAALKGETVLDPTDPNQVSTTYLASDEDETSEYFGAPFPSKKTVITSHEFISQDGLDNFVAHIALSVTVNANGVPTALVDNYRLECRG